MRNHDQVTQFQTQVYQMLDRRADAAIDLINALAANQGCKSVVGLSESPLFRRGHASIGKAIGALRPKRSRGGKKATDRRKERLRRPIGSLLEVPKADEPWVLAVDSTPWARPHARTLPDRSWVHQAQSVPGRPPVTIGHEYSLATVLPERVQGEPVWALPVASQRVSTATTAPIVGAEQIAELVRDAALPWFGQRIVAVADSNYSQGSFVGALAAESDLTTITRLRTNRVLFRQPPVPASGKSGRPRIYGAKLRPGTLDSLKLADEVMEVQTQIGGQALRVTLHRWNDLIIKGELDGHVDRQVVDVVLATVYDDEGQPRYRNNMSLVLVGDRRREVDREQAFAYYRRRFDQEHSHRFMRRDLLMDAYQSPLIEHEEAWMDIVVLAFQSLFAARDLVNFVRRPWEPKPKVVAADTVLPHLSLSPSQVKRDFARIIDQFGTPARPSKPRGIPLGWSTSAPRTRRKALPLVKRGPPTTKKQVKTA